MLQSKGYESAEVPKGSAVTSGYHALYLALQAIFKLGLGYYQFYASLIASNIMAYSTGHASHLELGLGSDDDTRSHEFNQEVDDEGAATVRGENVVPRRSTRPKRCSGCHQSLAEHEFGHPGPSCQGPAGIVDLGAGLEANPRDPPLLERKWRKVAHEAHGLPGNGPDPLHSVKDDEEASILTEKLSQIRVPQKQVRLEHLQAMIHEEEEYLRQLEGHKHQPFHRAIKSEPTPFLNEISAPPELGKMAGKCPVAVALFQTLLDEILGTGNKQPFTEGHGNDWHSQIFCRPMA